MSKIESKYESSLRLKSLICLKSYTSRIDERNIDEELDMSISNEGKIDAEEKEITVDVGLSVYSKDKSFQAEVVVRGIFEIPQLEDDKMLKNILKRNTVAIIFPYLRTQMTLITSQPGMSPVVIPAINVNALIDESESKDNQSD